jgi:hypothetical protein
MCGLPAHAESKQPKLLVKAISGMLGPPWQRMHVATAQARRTPLPPRASRAAAVAMSDKQKALLLSYWPGTHSLARMFVQHLDIHFQAGHA